MPYVLYVDADSSTFSAQSSSPASCGRRGCEVYKTAMLQVSVIAEEIRELNSTDRNNSAGTSKSAITKSFQSLRNKMTDILQNENYSEAELQELKDIARKELSDMIRVLGA